jgi:nucleoid-associated protein YgaU
MGNALNLALSLNAPAAPKKNPHPNTGSAQTTLQGNLNTALYQQYTKERSMTVLLQQDVFDLRQAKTRGIADGTLSTVQQQFLDAQIKKMQSMAAQDDPRNNGTGPSAAQKAQQKSYIDRVKTWLSNAFMQNPSQGKYTVKAGDNLSTIAWNFLINKYGMAPMLQQYPDRFQKMVASFAKQIAEFNGMPNENEIGTGQTLTIPVPNN